jgi:hypothetical protein
MSYFDKNPEKLELFIYGVPAILTIAIHLF